MACLMHVSQKTWPQVVVEGSSILFQHIGQVKNGSLGTSLAGSLPVCTAFDYRIETHVKSSMPRTMQKQLGQASNTGQPFC